MEFATFERIVAENVHELANREQTTRGLSEFDWDGRLAEMAWGRG